MVSMKVMPATQATAKAPRQCVAMKAPHCSVLYVSSVCAATVTITEPIADKKDNSLFQKSEGDKQYWIGKAVHNVINIQDCSDVIQSSLNTLTQRLT